MCHLGVEMRRCGQMFDYAKDSEILLSMSTGQMYTYRHGSRTDSEQDQQLQLSSEVMQSENCHKISNQYYLIHRFKH